MLPVIETDANTDDADVSLGSAPHRNACEVCILALLLQRVAELKCGEPWSRIRNSLAKLQATEFSSSQYNFFQINQARKDCRDFMRNLAIPLPAKVFGIKPAKNDP